MIIVSYRYAGYWVAFRQTLDFMTPAAVGLTADESLKRYWERYGSGPALIYGRKYQ